MITLLLGTIYGIGFGLTLVGGALYLIVLNGLHHTPNFFKLILGVIVWPITWAILGYKLSRLLREEFSL